MSSPKKPAKPRARKPPAKPRTSSLPQSPSRAPRPAKPPARRLARRLASPAKPPTKPPAKPRAAPKPRRVPKPPAPSLQPPAQVGPPPPAQASPQLAATEAAPTTPTPPAAFAALPPPAAVKLLASPMAAAHFAWGLVADLYSDHPEPLAMRRQIVTEALRYEAEETFGHLTTDRRAAHELERFLRLHIDSVRQELGFEANPPTSEAQALLQEDGVLAWDARLAHYLEKLGETGKIAATSLRKNALLRWEKLQQAIENPTASAKPGEVWALWADPNVSPPGCRFALLLARVLWNDVVASWIKRTACLVFPIFENVTRLHSRTNQPEERSGQRILASKDIEIARIERYEPLTLPTFEMAILEALLTRGLGLLGSVTAHRVLRWEVFEGHTRALRGDPDARALQVDGGWSGLAHTLGLTSKKAADEVHAIVVAQAHCGFHLPSGARGNLLSYSVVPARGQRKAEVTLILGDALLPHYVFTLRHKLGVASRAAREAQRLIPMVDLPPFVGREREFGQQATFSLTLVSELRARARELAEQGGIQLDMARMARMAERVGLPVSLLPRVIDRWLRDGSDGPAFLARIEKDRYTLGPAHSAAQAFLLEAGQRELAGAEAGKRSGASRRKARHLG